MSNYNPKSLKAEEFISHEEILETIEYAEKNKHNVELIDQILNKARPQKTEHGVHCEGLTHREASVLLACDIPEKVEEMYKLANEIKQAFYGNRIVMFAPLYLSNYCVNGCVYCPYHMKNKHIKRIKLTQDQIRDEVIALQDMGHKRLAIEAGEDPVHNSIEYILDSIKTIYSIQHKNGAIRRVNVNIAATTVENYRKLKDAGIQPFNYSDKDNYHFEHLMSALALKAYGTSIADDLASDKEAYNGEKMVAIYQKMKDMIDAGYWGDGILSTDFNTERNMFEAGKAAFTVDGTWNCGNFQNDSDTTLFDAQKIGVTRIPYIDEANKTVEMGGGSDTYYITTLNKSDEEIAATVKFIKYLTSVDSINEMCKSSPTTYAEKVTIDTGNYLLDDVNAIMAENTESKLEIPTYDSNTAAMDTIRNSLQALATGASAQEVGDDIVDKMSAYE